MAKSDTDPMPPIPRNDYRCRYCFLKFDNRKLLKSHVNGHVKNQDLHTCYFCGLRIRRKDNYDTHLRQHTGELHYACEFCGRSFMNIGSYSRHTCEILHCEFCGKYFNVGRRLQNHITTVHSATKNCPVNCTLCRIGFLDLQQYEQHVMSIDHINRAEQLDSVKVCVNGMDFENQAQDFSLRPGNGMTAVEKLPPIRSKSSLCKICRKTFPTPNGLNVHLASREHKLQALKVKIQKVKVKLKRVNNNSTEEVNPGFEPNQVDDNRIYSCNLCSKTFLSKLSLKGHVYTQHTAKESRKRWCQPCQRFISCESKLRRHLLSESHKYRSQEASMLNEDSPLSSSPAVQVGQLEKQPPSRGDPDHILGKSHVCAVCRKAFGSSSSLRCHKSRKHRKPDLPLPSSYPRELDKLPLKLDKKAAQEQESSPALWSFPKVQPIKIKLKKAPRKRKPSLETHTCHLCGKSYNNKSTLRHHMPVHTKQFECSWCGKCLRDVHDLNKHVRTHEKRYSGHLEEGGTLVTTNNG